MFNFKLFEAGSLGRGGISEAVLTLGLLTLRPQSPDAGRGADARREEGENVGKCECQNVVL